MGFWHESIFPEILEDASNNTLCVEEAAEVRVTERTIEMTLLFRVCSLCSMEFISQVTFIGGSLTSQVSLMDFFLKKNNFTSSWYRYGPHIYLNVSLLII